MNLLKVTPLAASVLIAAASFAANFSASAGEGCCAHCGCDTGCEKVCRLVCEERTIEITCWDCKCETFCLPGPSHRGCKNCDIACADCDKAACAECAHAKGKKVVWFDWTAVCAQPHTAKHLLKKTVTKKVPSFKWVVENACADCQAKGLSVQVPPGVSVPPPPAVDAKLLYWGNRGSSNDDRAATPATAATGN